MDFNVKNIIDIRFHLMSKVVLTSSQQDRIQRAAKSAAERSLRDIEVELARDILGRAGIKVDS